MAISRDAIDTIKGYYYQFDYYILQILSAENDEAVTIEGIEDVDVSASNAATMAIQCKYYAKTEYNHSVIAKALRWMFKDYASRTVGNNFIRYKLYGHYESGQSKLMLPLSVEFVKKYFLTYTENSVKHLLHTELNVNDEQVQGFIDRLDIDINAPSFEELEAQVIDKLKSIFQCKSLTEAELYYYNNALRTVKRLATQDEISNRNITRSQFLKEINNKNMLFDIWYIEFLGEREYCKKIKEEYFSQFNVSPIERFFIIECDSHISDEKIIKLLIKLSKNWSKLSARERQPFCPYVLLHNITDQRLVYIKNGLWSQGFRLKDGIPYLGANFEWMAITEIPNAQNGIRLKMVNKLSEIEIIFNSLSKPIEVYEFYLQNVFFDTEKVAINKIQIPSTESMMDII